MLGDRRLWTIALFVLACVGLIAGSKQFTLAVPNFDDPDASLRAIATQHLEVPDGLEQLCAALGSLPKGNVIFCGSFSDWGASETFLLTSCLHWPNQVWFLHRGGPLNVSSPPKPPDSARAASAIFFYGIDPFPGLEGNVRKIGPNLSIVTKPGAPR